MKIKSYYECYVLESGRMIPTAYPFHRNNEKIICVVRIYPYDLQIGVPIAIDISLD